MSYWLTMGFKKIKHVGSGVYARYYNKNSNKQITVQKAHRGKGIEVNLYHLDKGIGAKKHKKFSTKTDAMKYARSLMK